MKNWLPVLCAGVVLLGAVLSWGAAGRVSEVADRMLLQTQQLQRRLQHMIEISYTSTTGLTVKVTTTVGDQQDGESTDLVTRAAARLDAAKAAWPQAN